MSNRRKPTVVATRKTVVRKAGTDIKLGVRRERLRHKPVGALNPLVAAIRNPSGTQL
jgi:hypothetical protein